MINWLLVFLKRIANSNTALYRVVQCTREQVNQVEWRVRLGLWPDVYCRTPFVKFDPGYVRLPSSELVEQVRAFWYGSEPGPFNLDGENITRRDIFLHGGPDRTICCERCKRMR
jgi:hypothetical protein